MLAEGFREDEEDYFNYDNSTFDEDDDNHDDFFDDIEDEKDDTDWFEAN